MPFSKDNLPTTLKLLAGVIIGVVGIVAFVFLSDRRPENTTTIGTVVGALSTVIIVQLFAHAKLDKIGLTVKRGQEAAKDRTTQVVERLEEVKCQLDLVKEMPQNPDALRAFIRQEMSDAAPMIVKEALKQLRESGDLPGSGKAYT